MRKVVVVGGGISGLAVARALLASGAEAPEVVVLEREARLGGNIRTLHDDGLTLDAGPDSWVVAKPHASALARAVGLEGELVGTRPESRRVYVAIGGRLLPAPEGMVLGIPTEAGPFLRSPLFSPYAKLRMALEPLVKARAMGPDDDESIGSFLARRVGRDAADRLAVPMLGGIFAGDADELSIRMAFPQLVEAEARYGSLLRAMRVLAVRRSREAPAGEARPSAFVSLRGGMERLVEAVAADVRAHAGPVALRTCAEVVAVTATVGGVVDAGPRFVVTLASGDTISASHVVLTGPTHASASMLEGMDGALAESLAVLRYASTAIVFFAFPRAAILHPLDASGFLVPPARGKKTRGEILAATWVSSKWEGRAPGSRVLLRVFVGGAGREAVLAHDDAALAALALAELRTLMPLGGAPDYQRVFRYPQASPQPRVHHLAKVRAVHAHLARWPGLQVTTNGFEGIGIPDCVKRANLAADRILHERRADGAAG